MGRAPTRQQIQNKAARGCHFLPMASRITYIGPPCNSPLLSFPRNMLARALEKKFVDMPMKDVIHIQKSAPGPPMAIAAATPARFPIPTVEARAVDSAL